MLATLGSYLETLAVVKGIELNYVMTELFDTFSYLTGVFESLKSFYSYTAVVLFF